MKTHSLDTTKLRVASYDLVCCLGRNVVNNPRHPVFVRWCGAGSILAGGLFVVWGYIDRPHAPAYFVAMVSVLSFVVPSLFMVGLAGLYAQWHTRVSWLGCTGFVLGCIGSAFGAASGLWTMIGWYDVYILGDVNPRVFGWLLSLRLSWITAWSPLLFTGLALVGIAAARIRRLQALGILTLAMGACGGAYYFTDSGAVFAMRLVHVGFGMVFSLGWAVLGLMLWAGTTRPRIL